MNEQTSGIQLLVRRSGSATASIPSQGGVTQLVCILLMMPGVFVNFLALAAYPPLDRTPMGAMLCIFLFPVVLQLVSFVLWPNGNSSIWRILYISSSIALLLLATLLLLNGHLDKAAPSEVTTTVIRKTALRGRTTRYDLAVSSWRSAGGLEHFNVAKSVFDRAVEGKTATVEVHPGFFGVPWHGSISFR